MSEQTSIPAEWTAGETIIVRVSGDPANHTLSYAFSGPQQFQKTAVGSGESFLLTLAASDTEGLASGSYRYQARLVNTSTGLAEIIASGTTRVLPNLFAGQIDSPARQLVANLQVAINELSTLTRSTVMINGKSYTLQDIEKLHRLLLLAKRDLRQEESALYGGKSNLINVRFSRA